MIARHSLVRIRAEDRDDAYVTVDVAGRDHPGTSRRMAPRSASTVLPRATARDSVQVTRRDFEQGTSKGAAKEATETMLVSPAVYPINTRTIAAASRSRFVTASTP